MFGYDADECSFLEANLVDKYIGRIVEIIYLDRKEVITQRKTEVLGVQEGRAKD